MAQARSEQVKAVEARRDSASRAAPAIARARIGGRRGTLLGPGRPLEPATRKDMEKSFGRGFGGIRVHDDAHAHGSARALGALAYSAGNDIVFAQGQYAPQTAAGRALIAHELAHSVQQSGVAMKAAGRLPIGANPGLEAEADRAAVAVTSGRRVPALSTSGAPALHRATAAQGASGAQPPAPLPEGARLEIVPPDGDGSRVAVIMPMLTLPAFKGAGAWVKDAYSNAATGQRLNFSPVVAGKRIKATMEEPGTDYQLVWIKKHGFGSLKQIAEAFETSSDPDVKSALKRTDVTNILAGFKDGNQGGCDIDHIVEKQLGGGSVGANLQLLTRVTNQTAGRETYNQLRQAAEALIPCLPKATELQIRYGNAEFKETGAPDASYEIENLLRSQKVKGSGTGAPGSGAPVALIAGGLREIVNLEASGTTPIPTGAQRLVSALRLKDYMRQGKKQKQDEITADLATKPMTPGKSGVTLRAESIPDPTGPGEARDLKIDKHANSKVPFLIPYMSPGVLTEINYDAAGKVSGKGTITPTIKFLGKLDVEFGPDLLKIVKGIEPEKLKSPAPKVFRFTQGNLSLQLAPTFLASGSLSFTVGPAANPLILGELAARADGDAFVASGTLKPARKIPGVDKAEGVVEYHSKNGWSGKLTSSTSSIPGSTADLELGFTGKGGGLNPYGSGTLTTRIGNTQLVLQANWDGLDLSYKGGVTIPNPLPLVKEVALDGSYAKEVLRLTGNADIVWNQFKGSMKVTYVRKDGEAEGKFSGQATVARDTEKSSVKVTLKYNEAGKLTGSGTGAYQVTKDIRPELGIMVSEDGRIKATGEVKLKDIAFGKAWPAPPNDNKTIVKGGLKFRFPTPLVVVNGFGEITGSLGVRYGVGPVMLKGVVFNGELYPLEKDPKIKARLKGVLAVPAFGELYGTIGAFLGVEVLGGAVSLKGGIEARPALRVQGEAGLAIDAAYASGAFSFSAEAYAKGQMYVTLAINLKAEVSAGYGFWSHEWIYKVASMSKKLGPELKVTIGKIAYSPEGGMTWPSLSQIKVEPTTLDAMTIMKELMSDARDKEGTKEPRPK